jgi:hypothetical protein
MNEARVTETCALFITTREDDELRHRHARSLRARFDQPLYGREPIDWIKHETTAELDLPWRMLAVAGLHSTAPHGKDQKSKGKRFDDTKRHLERESPLYTPKR